MQPEHTYLAKMFNERVTDSVSRVKTIRKHFLEEQLLGEAWINIVSRCYLRWYVIGPLNQELVGAVIFFFFFL